MTIAGLKERASFYLWRDGASKQLLLATDIYIENLYKHEKHERENS